VSAAIDIEGVSKAFRLYKEKYTSFKERAIHLGRIPYEEFWALRDVTLDVEAGQTLGLIGRNGSGKSTLLKCIGGILQPTEGRIVTVGRLAALLELGAGFHPDLTGRENVYLNASILGMKQREIDRRFDEIVAFAELEQFIDNQVKHYSSGMYVRLGFAVAINMDPDILLVDEVLAVGDEAFQRKCLDKVRAFQKEGRTIVVVSHSVDQVRQICDRAACLDYGNLVAYGEPGEVIRVFREHLMPTAASDVEPEPGDPARSSPIWGKVRVTGVAIEYPASGDRPYLQPDEPMRLVISYEATEPLPGVIFGVAFYAPDGREVFGTNTLIMGHDLGVIDGTGQVVYEFERVPLLDGTYAVSIGVHNEGGMNYDWLEQQHHFEVMNPGRQTGIVSIPTDVSVRSARVEQQA
jgi:ABC-2 type transport system ATP-binding protein